MVSSFFSQVTRPLGKIYLTALLSAIAAGCGGRFYQTVDLPNGRAYLGMTGPELTALVGTPQSVGGGTYGCRYSRFFFGLEPGSHTIEWAWELPNDTLVAYLDQNVVQRLGLVPRKKKPQE